MMGAQAVAAAVVGDEDDDEDAGEVTAEDDSSLGQGRSMFNLSSALRLFNPR